jgi:plastocyanin
MSPTKGRAPVRKKLLLSLALITVLAGIGAAAAIARTKTVRMGDNYFFVGSVKIKKGSRVHWHWSGTENLHNVVSKKGDRFHSKTGHSGDFTHTFRKRGTFTIICTKHPSVMRMTVKVV